MQQNFYKKYVPLLYIFACCDALHDLAQFVQFKNLKKTHERVLLLVRQLY